MFILQKTIQGLIFQLLFWGILLFLPAGTLDWWRAWVLQGVIAVITVVIMLWSFTGNEELLKERFKWTVQKDQPLSDKILVNLFIILFVASIILIPLDVFRLHLMPKPITLISALGLFIFIAGWAIIGLVFRQNAFAVPVVKHQAERQQYVVDTGVYAIVRHPMYAGSLLFLIGMPLWLESYVVTLLMIPLTGLLVVRILFEEEFLKRELSGYDAYTKRVRYRLIPGIW